MKFTVVFLLAAFIQAKAATYAQNVSLNVRNASLSQVLGEIKKQSGYNFFYNDAMVKTGILVTVDMKSMPIEEALRLTLSNQPLTFSIVNKTVVLKDKMAQPEFTAVLPQPGEFHGRVADSLGGPLIGATIRVKGTKELVITDGNGLFTLKSVSDDQWLIISFTGYTTKEVPVKVAGRNDRNYLFMLQRSTNPLDEVQVIAYGTNIRRFNIGSVSTVTANDIKASGATNITNALNGRVPGMEVTLNSGVPGARQLMQVRGQNTLSPSAALTVYDQPLIIVDGVPFPSQNADISMLLNNFNTGTGGFSALNGLNPADIESISVLKDADATSIYGSQGANGVVVITTKKGIPGKNKINVRVVTGPSKLSRGLDMMNTQQYLSMRHQAIINDSISAFPSDPSYFQDLQVYDTSKYTDFAKKYFGGTANSTDAHLSISGGSAYNTFMVSAGYTRETYNFPGDFKNQRYSLHSSLSTRSYNNKFRADFGSDISYGLNNAPGSTSIGRAMMVVPDHPDMTDANGNLVWNYKGVDVGSDQLLAGLRQPFNVQSYLFNDYLRLSYEIIPGLNVTANAGYSMNMSKQYSASPLSSMKPGSGTASAGFGRSDNQTINLEPQVDYTKHFGDGVLSVLVGGTYKKVNNSSAQQLGNGYTDDALLQTIVAATTFSAQDAASLYKYVGGFGRINYIWKEKYIANLTGRRDGSSNFGPGHRFGSFGSAGLGWIISEEHFFDGLKSVVSFAKISGNYGTNGSDGNAPYNYQPYWKVGAITATPSFDNTRPYTASNLFNPNYSWASKHSINLGFDLGFMDNKLLMNVTYYRNRTSNQLTSYVLPTQTGFSSVVQNMNATLQDNGLELTITTRNVTSKDFRWTTQFNISGNRNKLISFPGLATSPYNATYAVGKSTSLIYGFKSAGVNDTTGVFQYYKGNGKSRTYTPSYTNVNNGGDMQAIANAQTDFYGGLTNTFSYKNWGLSLFFKFSKATARNYLSGLQYASPLPGGQVNLPVFMQDMFWTKPGDNATLQRLTTGYYGAARNGQLAQRAGIYFNNSDAVYSDNTYLRLKSVYLTYSLPASTLKKVGIQGCTFNITAQNLFTITNYKFGDPEMPGTLYTVPLQRIITGGFSLDF